MSALLSTLLFASPLTAPPQEIYETIYLHESTTQRFNLVFSGEEPEPEYNCDEVAFVDGNLMMLVQVPTSADTTLRTNLRILAKDVAVEAVLRASSAMNGLLASGGLHGIEVDWYFPTNGVPPTTNRLGVICELVDVPSPEGTLRALLYAYSQSQYDSRVAALTSGLGHGLDMYPTWISPVLSSTGTDFRDISIWSVGNEVIGDVSSVEDLRLWGSSFLLGDAAFGGFLEQKFGPSIVESQNRWPLHTPQVAYTVEALRALAQAGGVYAPGNLTLNASNVPTVKAVVFAEGNLKLNASNVTAALTLVSAGGKVEILGDGNHLTPALGWVTGIAFQGRFRVLGDNNTLLGTTCAPVDWWSLWGNGNLLTGTHWGHGMSIGGTGNLFADGTVLEPLY